MNIKDEDLFAGRNVEPAIPPNRAIVIGPRHAFIASRDGDIEKLALNEASSLVASEPFLACHIPTLRTRLGVDASNAWDVLELFAFIEPAQICLPTVWGLGRALDLSIPTSDLEYQAISLFTIAERLIERARLASYAHRIGAAAIARMMQKAGWPWSAAILDALGDAPEKSGADIWNRLPEWEESAPPRPPKGITVSPVQALSRLDELLGPQAEERQSQRQYVDAVTAAFAPRTEAGSPNIVLAEAGTGVGKTVGYIAPASVWAEHNDSPVWISTFTKNLQRQIDQELDRLYPDPARKKSKAVIRKGRENYLCLLNLSEAVERLLAATGAAPNLIALGLICRWAGATRDGDMIGGDFPAWLTSRFGAGRIAALTDQRGECIYSACSHYRRCFIERTIRSARHADIVVANHALVMTQAVLRKDEAGRPTRYVFDEGHHLFDAADAAFSAHLTGRESAELRRWIRGAEERRRSRGRGLRERLGELAQDTADGTPLIDEAIAAARALPAPGWLQRVGGGMPRGNAEHFFALLRNHVYARASHQDDAYSLEAPLSNPSEELLSAAKIFDQALERIRHPLAALAKNLVDRLDDETADLDSTARLRIEALARGLIYRCDHMLGAWRSMIEALPAQTPEVFFDFATVDRFDGHDIDVGLHRHWIDPTQPFSDAVLEQSHGAVITSATLRDQEPHREISGDDRLAEDNWLSAEIRSGASHLVLPAARSHVDSPFDYAGRTRVLIVTDVNRRSMEQVAAAYRELFLAAQGGALGLFTAIRRLRSVHSHIAQTLESAGLPLYAQHVDPFDTGTLVDIFRADESACLLGTDAVRDGVDVPGAALRLIVFDRVPWPRPTLLHRERRETFGGRHYDDMIARLRLKQAYGRLIRQAADAGVFVILDPATPSRLLAAFPDGVQIERTGIAEAVSVTRRLIADYFF